MQRNRVNIYINFEENTCDFAICFTPHVDFILKYRDYDSAYYNRETYRYMFIERKTCHCFGEVNGVVVSLKFKKQIKIKFLLKK